MRRTDTLDADRPRAESRTRSLLLVVAALAAICCLPLAKGTMLISEPYGDSHDGRNGSTWAAGAEGLRDDPIGNKLGAVRPDGTVYANHPPAILLAVAAAEFFTSDSPASDRAIFLLALWASLLMTFALLVELDFAPVMALAGTAAMAATGMVRAYGSMVDTPMLALPVAIALLLATARGRRRGSLPGWGVAVFGLAPLISWQLMLLEALVLASMTAHRPWRPLLRRALFASLVGGAATGTWLLWVHGGISPVVDQLLLRSSTGSEAETSLGDALDYQWTSMTTLVGPLLIAAAATVLLLCRDGDRRWIGACAILSVALYGIVLSNGAAYHDYWLYWVVILVALGGAAALEGLLGLIRRRGFPRGVLIASGVALVVVTLLPALATTPQERSNAAGVRAAQALRLATLAPGQESLWLLADIRRTDRWLSEDVPVEYLTPRRAHRLMNYGGGDEVVLASTSCSVPNLACGAVADDSVPYHDRRFFVTRVADIAGRTPQPR